MYVTNLVGTEYPIQATSTNDIEVNGNHSLSASIYRTNANGLFINDIQEMWRIVDHDGVEHKIIYVKRSGKGDSLKVEVKAIPLFFDALDNDRIYTRYDEHMTAKKAFDHIFKDTGFTYVLVDSFSAVEWEGFGEGETKLETFKRALDRYKCEFRILGNTVYLESQVGRDTQFQYRHRLNASNIVQEIDAREMWTYAKGYGDYGNEGESGEEGGEDWENAKLIEEYTSPLADIIGIRHAPPIKDGRITRKAKMQESLKELVDESLKISVSADVIDLQKQGYPIAQSEVGDRVFLIDERIGLDDEVRVVSQSKTRNWKGEVIDLNITFGSEGLTKRHQGKIDTAIKNITDIVEGNKKLPFSVLDNAVQQATKDLKSAQTELIFDNGIIAQDKEDPNKLVLFNSSGIGISNDGGGTFTTAMTGGGVVADVVTSGTFRGLNFEGGYLYSQNNNTEWDLNSGELKMENADFTLKSGALINFTSRGNRLQYYNSDRYSGLGVGLGIDHNYPLTYVGVSENTSKLDAEDNSYRGLITQSKTAISKGFPHTLIGEDVWFRKDSKSSAGIRMSFTSNSIELYGSFAGDNNYKLGTSSNLWQEAHVNNAYLNNIESNNFFTKVLNVGDKVEIRSSSNATRIGPNAKNNGTYLLITDDGKVGIQHNGNYTSIV